MNQVKGKNSDHSLLNQLPLFMKIGFFIELSLIGIHFLVLFVFILAKVFISSSFLGQPVELRQDLLQAGAGAMTNNFVGIYLPASIIASAISCCCFLVSNPKKKNIALASTSIKIGFVNYIILNILIIISRPLSLAFIPIIRTLPFAVGLFLIFIVIITLAVKTSWKSMGYGYFSMIMIIIINLPHHYFHKLLYPSHGKANSSRDKVVLLSIDSARYDHTIETGLLKNVYTGFSEFESTRKQWMTLLTGSASNVDKLLFLPSINDPNFFVSDFILDSQRKKISAAFLMDEGSTANNHSLPLNGVELRINGAGIHSQGAPEYIPISAWLNNIATPIESINIYSDVDSFLEDVIYILNNNDLTLAHTCYLQRGLSSWEDLYLFEGFGWLKRKPIHLLSPLKNESPDAVKLVEAISKYKIKFLIKKISSIFDLLEKTHPGFSGLLTADHGQYYHRAANGMISSTHGFFTSPETSWIPIVPFGKTVIHKHKLDGVITWVEISKALDECIQKNTNLQIIAKKLPLHNEYAFIKLPGNNWDHPATDILSIDIIAKNIHHKSSTGLTINLPHPIGHYKKSYKCLQPNGLLVTINPHSDHTYLIQYWDKYILKREYIIDEVDLSQSINSIYEQQ